MPSMQSVQGPAAPLIGVILPLIPLLLQDSIP